MSASQRYLEMDALRGFAVMGILLMNIVGFSMPEMAYINPSVFGGTDTPDIVAWLLSFLFVDGKMRGLFTFLFGASLILICDRAEAKGENPAKTHFSRMCWLALFGLVHFFFIWWGDILFLYATIGSIAYFMHKWDARKLVRSAIILYITGFVIYSAFLGSLFFLQQAAETAGAGSELDRQYQEAIIGISPSAAEITQDISLHLASYGELLRYKIVEMWSAPLGAIIQNAIETLPFMMLGMALYKNGFLTGRWEAARYRRVAMWTFPIGLAILLPIGLLVLAQDFDPLVTLNAVMAWSMPARLLMTVGYLALLILIIQTFSNSALIRRVAAAGRAAFTNYLGTSVLMTFIFYGWGLGLYGSIGRAEIYLLVLGAWALMLLWSQAWLMRFRYGPLEWLWRSLAKGQAQPMRMS